MNKISTKLFFALFIILSLIAMQGMYSQPNIALTATCTHSSGGSGVYGPQNYNDGLNPTPGGYFGWTSGSSSSGLAAWIMFDWGSTAQTLGQFTLYYVSTTTRYMSGGTIQYWDGANWISCYTFSVPTPVMSYTFSFPVVTTTKVRITNFVVIGSQSSNPNFHEIEIRNPIPPTDQIIVTPTSLLFQFEETASAPPPQNINVSTIPATLSWTTTLTGNAAPPALPIFGINPIAGTGAATVVTSILRADLTTGTYPGNVNFASPTAVAKNVPLTLLVIPRVMISPSSDPAVVKFGCKAASLVTKTIQINNLGGHCNGGVLQWNASTTASEINILTPTGVEGGNLTFTINAAGMPTGTTYRTITITGKNSITGIPASNSPFTLNVKIEVEPQIIVNQTQNVTTSFTDFTNVNGHVVASMKSNGAAGSATVEMHPCEFPIGLPRVRPVKRWFKITTALTNCDVKFYYTNTELALGGVPNANLLKIWQQPVLGGAWFNRGGTADPNNNNVLVTTLTNFSGVFIEAAPWTPKALPLNLSNASFDRASKNAVLQWNTPLLPNEDGFMIMRANDMNANWEVVGTVSPNSSGDYGFSDKIFDEGTYFYRISMIDNEGIGFESGALTVNASFGPLAFALEQNYPNPFNPKTQIAYSIPQNAFVRLSVYDKVGRVVSELVNNELKAGRHVIEFDAMNLPSGQYFYRIVAGSFIETKTMMITK